MPHAVSMPPLLRLALLASGPLNLLGAALFSPPGAPLRAAFGVPEGPDFYQWTLAAWVLAFGIAYAHAGWTGHADRTLLALGAFGKAIFVAVLFREAAIGAVPWLAAFSSLPDLALAAVFVKALRA